MSKYDITITQHRTFTVRVESDSEAGAHERALRALGRALDRNDLRFLDETETYVVVTVEIPDGQASS